MKKLLLTAIIIATAVGCSKKTTTTGDNDGRVEIKLSSGIAVSKAALDNTSAVTGLVFHRVDNGDAGAFLFDLGTPSLMANRATNGDITFDVPQYYNNDTDYAATNFLSYYPAGTIANNVVTWAIDGKTDIMTTILVRNPGSKDDPQSMTMPYLHELAMVEVSCKAETGKDTEVQSRWGKVVGLKLKNTQPNASLDYSVGLEPGTKVNDVVFAGTPTTIALWGADFAAFAPITLAATNTAVQSRGMFAPYKGVLDLVITTQRDGGNPVDKELKITLPGAAEFKAGFKHLLTLTFKASLLEEIEVTSTIKDWEVGTGASGDVD